MSPTIGYARVSTVGQSLESQTEQLEQAGCKRIFKEKVSGVKRDRPELEALLDYVREGDTVVITKMDRVARSTRHLLEIVDTLKDKGVSFKVLNMNLDTSTPNGKLMLTMLAGIAEFEREMMLERQREGIERAKKQGKYTGRQKTARAKASQVFELIDQGITNRQEIADNLGIGIASVYRILKEGREKA